MWSLSGGAHQLWTSWTEGVPSKWSGSRLISFMMLDKRTGSSWRRNTKEVRSQALIVPGERARLTVNFWPQLMSDKLKRNQRLQHQKSGFGEWCINTVNKTVALEWVRIKVMNAPNNNCHYLFQSQLFNWSQWKSCMSPLSPFYASYTCLIMFYYAQHSNNTIVRYGKIIG